MVYESTGSGEIAINKDGEGHALMNVVGEIYAIKARPGDSSTPECVVEIHTSTGEEIILNHVDKPILAKPRVAVSTPEHASMNNEETSERPINFGPLRIKIRQAKPETIFEGFIAYYKTS